MLFRSPRAVCGRETGGGIRRGHGLDPPPQARGELSGGEAGGAPGREQSDRRDAVKRSLWAQGTFFSGYELSSQ